MGKAKETSWRLFAIRAYLIDQYKLHCTEDCIGIRRLQSDLASHREQVVSGRGGRAGR
jgi:hypothetical protein